MSEINKGVVLYTDGGAKPNPGRMGVGIHGYLYEVKEIKKPVIVDNYFVTNKGYLQKLNDNVEIVEPINYFDFVGSRLTDETNNYAELQALYIGLTQVERYNPKYIHILTDSEYIRNGITKYCITWSKFNWMKQDGTPVINGELWKTIWNKYQELIKSGVDVTIDWIRSHSDHKGNTQADILASIGRMYSADNQLINQFNIYEPKKYWNPDIDKHPFINFKRVYFNSVRDYNILGVYFQAEPGKSGDFILGKRIPETGFSIIKLKEPDEVIEVVKEKQYSLANENNSIIFMKLDRIYDKDIYPYLSNYGKYAITEGKGNLNLNFFDNKPITLELNPTGLSLTAIESFNYIDSILSSFIKSKNGEKLEPLDTIVSYHNVTDKFYNIKDKKVKNVPTKVVELNTEINVGFKDIKIDIEELHEGKLHKLSIPLILGLDLPPRNNLKRLEEHNPEIYLIVWKESINSLRYATVINCDTGIGIWSNFFADRIFIK